MRLILSSLLFASLTRVYADAASDVLELTADTFDKTVNPADLILVEFFAPWCGHCKALAPHYEEAATALKSKSIPIAKVDCVDQSDLCQKHGVTGYPTLKVFRNGTPTEYQGPRKADGIISYMVKQSLPAVTTVTTENHDEFKDADKVVVVLYAPTGIDVSEYAKFAEAHRDDYLFGQVSDASLIQSAGVKAPGVVVYKKFDDKRADYTGDVAKLDSKAFADWLKSVGTPLFDEVSGENYSFYAEAGLPLGYIFVDPTVDGKDELLETYKPIAKKYKGKLNFVWIDAVKFAEHGKAMNLNEAKWPAFVIQDMAQQLKYPHSQANDLTPESVEALVEQYVSGKLEPELKSEPIPESQDEPVFVLVTKQFDEVVYDDSKDVLVEFYAPWCGHCKRLKPTWDQLGEKYADIKDRLVIAKMDATENDIPPSAPFRVSGFPTIKFKPAGSRDFIEYSGDRSYESLVEFVEQNAKNPLEPPAATETKGSSGQVTEEIHNTAAHDGQKHVEL